MLPEICIVALGDSITRSEHHAKKDRWVSLLARNINCHFSNLSCCCINSGIGGNTSREALARIQSDVIYHEPDYVIIEFGGNDATSDEQRHVSLEEFKSNIGQLSRALTKDTRAQIILMTFPPVIDAWHSDYENPFFHDHGGQDRYIDQYRMTTRAYAREHKLPLIDIDKQMRKAIAASDASEYILPDGVHLTLQGERLVADAVSSYFINTMLTKH